MKEKSDQDDSAHTLTADGHQFAHLHSPISSLTTKNIDNRKISREDQYQPAQSDWTLCWLLCRRPVVEVQQTGHVNLSFIKFNFRQKHNDQTANLRFQFQHTELVDSLF